MSDTLRPSRKERERERERESLDKQTERKKAATESVTVDGRA